MSVSKSKRISASVRIAMSLCLVVCVIWNYAITSNIIRGNNSLCLGALMAATDALFSLPVETIPRKATNQRHDKDDEFAVCLKIMDANHELIEWLAYNYHTLNMKRLIVYQDLKSATTPKPIFDRWKGRIDVSLWDTAEQAHPGFTPKKFNHDSHVKAQNGFTLNCFKALKAEGYRWVGNFDPDEYVTINERVYIQGDPMYEMGLSNITNDEKDTMDPIPIPSAYEPGSTLHFIRNVTQHVQKYGSRNQHSLQFFKTFETPCFQMLRKQYSPFQNNANDVDFEPKVVLQGENNQEDPVFPFDEETYGLSPSQLSTWRWRFFGKTANKNSKGPLQNVIGKALMDFSTLQPKDFSLGATHAPLKEPLCNAALKWPDEKSTPLVMNHYPLPWEQGFMRSNDSRAITKAKGNLTKYRIERYLKELEYRDAHEPHGHILEWLSGFVDSVGKEEAARLLQHAGDPILAAKGAWLRDDVEAKRQDKIVPPIPLQVVLDLDLQRRLEEKKS